MPAGPSPKSHHRRRHRAARSTGPCSNPRTSPPRTGLGIHTRWIETDFADSIPADPDYSTTAPDGERRTITVDVDGRRLAVGLPADLLDGWARSGSSAPAGVSVASDGGAAAAGDPGELRADMAGTVVKWLVEPGSRSLGRGPGRRP